MMRPYTHTHLHPADQTSQSHTVTTSIRDICNCGMLQAKLKESTQHSNERFPEIKLFYVKTTHTSGCLLVVGGSCSAHSLVQFDSSKAWS